MNIATHSHKILKVDFPLKKTIIKDYSRQYLRFNILPDKFVEETLIIDRYVLDNNKIEVYFDRLYKTDMKKSPNHYIFLSSLINLQKMIYLLMCERFNIKYSEHDDEKFKIWPLQTSIEMKGMVRDSINIMQDFHIDNFKKISNKKYYVYGQSSTNSIINITGSALVYIL
jgi:hypothetical protein